MDGDGDAAGGEAISAVSFGAPTAGGTKDEESSQVVEADEALLSRLALIGDRPIPDRAAAFRQLHDELRSDLEATDVPNPGVSSSRGDPSRTA